MTVFGCRACGAALTGPVSRVAFPVHARQKWGNGPGSLEPALEPGTFAEDPLPSGTPWRRWEEVDDAEALGWYAPRYGVCGGPPGHVLLAPGEIRNAAIEPALVSEYGCCGLDGNEPNMVCLTCRTPVALRVDDCGLRHAVWLNPLATHVIDDGPGPHPVLDWPDLLDQRPGIPPSEPDGGWHPVWAAAVATALAHLLAASDGHPILLVQQRVADFFQPTLTRLGVPVSTGPPSAEPGRAALRRTGMVLAGPGLPPAAGDLALVPQHPQTGELWPVARPAKPIPLAWDVWSHLAFHRDPRPVGRSVPLLPESLPPLLPGYRLEPDGGIFLSVLARLPQVRQPWLRAIYDRGRPYHYGYCRL
ncbi:hypothetical protein ACTI_74440 [Actinoplanes sp. OR16]|uniref:hypothetical protein n=1 Tax=Actinoplanes sp. OR16 TaxID=946334 RepID=UPI000F711CE7|nr:hypothetical protein [Actinoplanes sp. OR16]BBH70759.1 hypothetical protein ACTI_74440 [Actinoplanes sp. OR16]